MTTENRRARGIAAAVAAGCFWGTTGLFVRALDGYGYSPLTIVFVRMSLAWVMIVALFVATGRTDLFRVRLKDLWCFVGAGVSSSLLLSVFYSISMVLNPVAVASILLSGSSPIFVIALSALIFRERITARKIQALTIVVVGCVLTSGVLGASWLFSPKGVAIGLLAGLGSGLYSIMSRFALNRGYDSRTINVYSFGIAALACAPFANFPVVAQTVSDAPLKMLAILLAHSLLVSLVPYMLFTYALTCVDTGTAPILASSEPIAALILGLVLYSEVPSLVNLAGMVLVLFGLVVLNVEGGIATIFRRIWAMVPKARRHG